MQNPGLVKKGADDLAALGIRTDHQANRTVRIHVVVTTLRIILDDKNNRVAGKAAFGDGFNHLTEG